MTDGPYARLYLSLVDDPKFATIYDDDHHFAAWCRLLMIAEPAWPASAHLPAIVRKASVEALASSGLIDLQPGGRYRVHGLDAERNDRHEQARKASNARWNARGNAASNAGASDVRMPNRAEYNQDQAEPTRDVPDGRKDLEAWMLVRGFNPPSPRQRAFLDGYVRTFDLTGPARAERLILSNPDDPIAALKKDLDAFRAERREAAVAEEAPKPAPRRKPSGLTGINGELAQILNRQYAEKEGKA